MLLLGAFGASVVWGIQQSIQMPRNQPAGFISGEWQDVTRTPRKQMYIALVLLAIAALIMAFGNTLAKE